MRRMCYHFFQQLNTLTLKFYIFISSMHPCFEANLWDWRISLSVCDCVYLLVFVWMFSCVYFLVCRQILDTLVICEILMVLFVSYGSLLTSQTHTHTHLQTLMLLHTCKQSGPTHGSVFLCLHSSALIWHTCIRPVKSPQCYSAVQTHAD